MKEKVINDTIKDGVCSGENKDKREKKILFHDHYDDPGIYEEFRPFWGPGSSYKPWRYGK